MSFVVILAVVLLLLYGSDRIALVGKGLGEGVKTFRKVLRNAESPPPAAAPEVTPKRADPKLLPAKGETTRTAGDDSDDPRGGAA